MTSNQKQYLLSKMTDIWHMIDTTSDPERVQRYLGKLDGIYMTLEMFGYRVVRNQKTGKREIITQAKYDKYYA